LLVGAEVAGRPDIPALLNQILTLLPA